MGPEVRRLHLLRVAEAPGPSEKDVDRVSRRVFGQDRKKVDSHLGEPQALYVAYGQLTSSAEQALCLPFLKHGQC